ncbi:hypothetical protein WMW71_02925 [Flavobacterium buctense]|uniref:Uncharacterized protein n=1 Tax=Flavobacterium buctense TaxID=1648146 RepID=A0ABU9DYI0_9FLAO|nr:hypothetical protein [Flavobacterium buctense]
MNSRGKTPIAIFPVNGKYVLAVYQGNLSKFDLLLKYRERDSKAKSGWSRVRTPKHIHWAVDILLKMQENEKDTKKFLDFLINSWTTSIKSIKSEQERDVLLDVRTLLTEVDKEALNYVSLANKGEYSVKFLILIAKLLMVQEKTNMETAFMFKNLLDALRKGEDIFKIVSIATHR